MVTVAVAVVMWWSWWLPRKPWWLDRDGNREGGRGGYRGSRDGNRDGNREGGRDGERRFDRNRGGTITVATTVSRRGHGNGGNRGVKNNEGLINL